MVVTTAANVDWAGRDYGRVTHRSAGTFVPEHSSDGFTTTDTSAYNEKIKVEKYKINKNERKAYQSPWPVGRRS